MTSNRLIIGLFGLLLFSSIVSAYTDDGSAFYCTNCSDCTNALNNNTYNITYLNATISGAAGTCIGDPDNIDGKTFNCNGYTISGTGSGSGILISGETDAWIYGCVVSGFLDGIVISDSSDNVTVEYSDTLNNGNAGVFVQSSSNINILDVVSAHNSLYGILVQFSNGCYLNGNAVENNTYGFDIDGSDLNTINNSATSDNSFYGVYIHNDADNNTVWSTFAYNNLGSGFVIQGLDSNFNRIYSSDATNNTNDGFYLTTNNWTWITDTTSYLNGRDGYRFQSSIWINLTNGTSYDNTGNGYSYNSGLGYLVAYSKAYNNSGYGLNAWGPTTINFLTFSEIYDNGLDGVFIEDGSNLHALRNDTIYGNTGWGFYAQNAHYHVAVNITIYDNAGGGMAFDNSDNGNYSNLVLYNNSLANSYAMEFYGSTGNRFDDVLIYEETNYIYNYPDATPNNFTNLTLGYNAEVGLINWDFLSITDIDLNSSNVILDPYFVSLDSSVASQANASANVSIYAESWYDVYRADGFPLTRDTIINTGYIYPELSRSWANGILRFGVADFSGYAAKGNCFYADTPDTIYNITGNLYGNKSDSICITINTSNVTIQCNGYSVIGTDAGTTYGIRTTASADNITILDCLVRNYTYGVRLDNTITDSSISNTTSYNNSVDGFFLNTDVSYVNLTDCTAYDNTDNGFDLRGSSNVILYGVAHDNSGDGFASLAANNFMHTISYDNGGNGFATASASSEVFVNCTAYGNTLNGFLIGGGNEQVYNSTARNNNQYGFYFMAQNTFCSNCEAYENDGGLYINRNTTVNGATLYNNSNTGPGYELYIDTVPDEPAILSDVFIHTASKFIYKRSTATQFNFTNLTIGYNNTIGLANWAFANISDLNLTLDNFIPDPEFISMNSSDSNAAQMNLSANLTIGTPTCFEVYPRVKAGFPQSAPDIRFNGSFCPTCNLYSCVSNVGQFDVPDWSGYALGPNISECMIINSSGSYHLNNNIEGASIPFGNIYGLSNTCILIESSNVSFTCNGYNITNNGTANSVGIAVNASSGTPYTNITIRDCPAISLYTEGIYTQYAHDSRIQNSTAYNNTEAGFLLLNVLRNNLTDNTAYSTGASGTRGFYLAGYGIHRLVNNTAYSTDIGFDFYVCGVNNITDNWAYDNTIGFHLNDTSNNNNLWYNRAEDNEYGFELLSVYGNKLINNTARDNTMMGFYLEYAYNNNLTDDEAYNNQYGIYAYYADNNSIQNSTAYNNTKAGFMLYNAMGNNLTDNTAYSTGASGTRGFFLAGMGFNRLLNNTAYSTDIGFDFYVCGVNNITDNWAYDNTIGFHLNDTSNNNNLWYNRAEDNEYGFELLSVYGNKLINNTARDNTMMGFYLLYADDNNLTVNTAFNNSRYGFYLSQSSENTLVGNFENYSRNTLAGYGFQVASGSVNNVLNDNEAYDNYRYGFEILADSNNLSNNTAAYNGFYGFAIASNLNRLLDNTAYLNGDGISLNTAASDNVLENNTARDNYRHGFFLWGNSANNNLTDNEAYNNTANGIHLTGASSNRIIANFVYDNTGNAIYAETSSDNNVFSGNDMHDNVGGGIRVRLSSGNEISDNTGYDNGDGGVFLFSTTGGTVINNTMHDNPFGIVFNQLASLPAFENNTAYNNSAGFVLYMTNGFDTTAANQGNELYENSFGLYIFNSSNHVITRVLNLHTNGFEIYVNGTVDELTIEETNTPEAEYLTLENGAVLTNLHLLYNYSDVNGRVSFPSITATAASADKPLNNTNFLLEPNFASLNDSAQQDFNTTANITLSTSSCPVNVYNLEGFPQSRAEIIANGSIYSATFIDCSGTSAEFGVTSFSGYALNLVPPPSGGGGDGDECDDLDIDLVSRECPSNMITFSFVDDMGDPITGERIRVDGPVLSTQYYDTDSDGEISFAAWADGTYRVRVTTASDYCTDEYVLSYTLCPEEGCYDDEDCDDDEYCSGATISTPGECLPVECECGEIRDHRCEDYECCSDEDCSEGERCVDHECVGACEDDSQCAGDEYCSDGSCLRVEGDCGYAENHTWYNYECCGDDDCPFGFICQEYECVLYRIITNETGFVGDDHLAYVLPEGQYTLGLIDPVGNRQTLVTDPAGRVSFILESEGQYSIFLVKDEGIAANVTVDALKRVIIPEERPTTLLDQLLNLCWILVILALLVIAYILYRRKKEEKAGYKYKK